MIQQVLNILVISDWPEPARQLQAAMQASIVDYRPHFQTQSLAILGTDTLKPDLIFIDSPVGLTSEDVLRVTSLFPRTACVVVGDCDDQARHAYIRSGADEVMSLDDLASPIGKHLLEKLLAFKDLAEAKRQILLSEERFKGVIEHAHEIILLIDADGTIIYASPAFGRQTGYDEWEVLGRNLFEFIHAEDVEAIRLRFASVCHSTAKAAHSLEYRFGTKAGAWRYYDVTATNLLQADTVGAVVMNMRDITTNKEAEEQLEVYRLHLEKLVESRTRELVEVQTRANTVIDASPDALLAMDNDGVILFISEHYKLSYPKSAAHLVPGRRMADAFVHVAAEIGIYPHEARYQDMLAWWQNPHGTKEFRMNSGTWLRLRAKEMQGRRGRVVATTNITDLKRQQSLLAEKSAVLAAALDMERGIVEQQKTFVSMVSHEFRTPLTIIDGNAQIIQSRGESIEPAALIKRAGTIRASVDRLVRLIEAILSAHMLDSGRLTVERTSCNIEHILRNTIAEQQEISPGHFIMVDMADLPDTMWLDERIIGQMMTNLLSNAVKYSPGRDRIEVKAARVGDAVVISVKDEGVGIPAKELPRITTKYFRASTASGIPGTGLGLNLVRQFVDLHQGSFDIQSTEGKGTVVTICLPIMDSTALSVAEPHRTAAEN